MPAWAIPLIIQGGEALLVGLMAGAAVYNGVVPGAPAHALGPAFATFIMTFGAKVLPTQMLPTPGAPPPPPTP